MRKSLGILATLCLLLCTSCSAPTGSLKALGAGAEKPQVVATTAVIADLARSVAGDRAQVTSLIPQGADPHSYEPSLRNIRDVAYADVAFTNGMLLEPNKLLKAVESNLPSDARQVAIAENIESYGGKLEPMVEDSSLDSIWLGLRVEAPHATSDSTDTVTFHAESAEGPGRMAAFITQTFGAVEVVASTEEDGSTDLPLAAHTHLSWGFTAPGEYRLTVSADAPEGYADVPGSAVHFVVGEDPSSAAARLGSDTAILDAGHADLTAQVETGKLVIRTDTDGEVKEYDPAHTVIAVPSNTLQEIPAGSQYRFLGSGGDQVYLLAQAVLGKHVHGEIDPHLWHSVPNAIAAVQLIRDTLVAQDPAGASVYKKNAADLIEELESLDRELAETYGSLPEGARNLVTTHDGYRYLATTYGLKVAGFVSPAPGSEPSIQQRHRLRQTVEDLHVPALYLEHGSLQVAPVLEQVGKETNTRVCELYSDSLDAQAPHYADMMRANAQTITTCSR